MTEQARVKIVCPECGGPLPPEAANVTVKCERCGCASAPVVSGKHDRQQPCPRCSAPLFEGDAHGIKMLGCGACGGIFLDNDGSMHITRAHDSVIAQLAARARDRAVATAIDNRPHALPCPMCSALMRRTLARGVAEIDFCSAHGTWLDRGELNRVMDAYAHRPAPVDADAASRADAERRLAALREVHMEAIERAENTSAAGAFGVTLGVLGVLAALVGGADA